MPFFKSTTSNEVYCTGATEGSTEVDVQCFFYGQDPSTTAHFGSATAVNSVAGMLVYRVKKPASSNVQIVTPIQTKSVDGTKAEWSSDMNYFYELGDDMSTVQWAGVFLDRYESDETIWTTTKMLVSAGTLSTSLHSDLMNAKAGNADSNNQFITTTPTVYGTADASTTLKFKRDSTGWVFATNPDDDPDNNVSAGAGNGIMICADWWSNEGVTHVYDVVLVGGTSETK